MYRCWTFRPVDPGIWKHSRNEGVRLSCTAVGTFRTGDHEDPGQLAAVNQRYHTLQPTDSIAGVEKRNIVSSVLLSSRSKERKTKVYRGDQKNNLELSGTAQGTFAAHLTLTRRDSRYILEPNRGTISQDMMVQSGTC